MTSHQVAAIVVMVAAANGLALLGVHGYLDHGWARQLRAWLARTPYPLPAPHVHWYENLPRRTRRAGEFGYLAVCLAVAALFEPVPWLAAGIAWGFVIGAAYLLVRSHRAAGRGDNRVR
jgi:hypothetical protein